MLRHQTHLTHQQGLLLVMCYPWFESHPWAAIFQKPKGKKAFNSKLDECFGWLPVNFVAWLEADKTHCHNKVSGGCCLYNMAVNSKNEVKGICFYIWYLRKVPIGCFWWQQCQWDLHPTQNTHKIEHTKKLHNQPHKEMAEHHIFKGSAARTSTFNLLRKSPPISFPISLLSPFAATNQRHCNTYQSTIMSNMCQRLPPWSPLYQEDDAWWMMRSHNPDRLLTVCRVHESIASTGYYEPTHEMGGLMHQH